MDDCARIDCCAVVLYVLDGAKIRKVSGVSAVSLFMGASFLRSRQRTLDTRVAVWDLTPSCPNHTSSPLLSKPPPPPRSTLLQCLKETATIIMYIADGLVRQTEACHGEPRVRATRIPRGPLTTVQQACPPTARICRVLQMAYATFTGRQVHAIVDSSALSVISQTQMSWRPALSYRHLMTSIKRLISSPLKASLSTMDLSGTSSIL